MESLKVHYKDSLKETPLRVLLNDKERVSKVQFLDSHSQIMLDASHTKIDSNTLDHFQTLLNDNQIQSKKEAMFSGQIMNPTENRAVLHTALRAPSSSTLCLPSQNNHNIIPDVHTVLSQIQQFTSSVRDSTHLGHSGQPLHNTLVIGIGGSYLSIEFVYEALRYQYPQANRQMRFLANVDPIDFQKATEGLDPSKTLIIINSKTFTTAETMLNAKQIRKWLLTHYQSECCDPAIANDIISKHVVACSTNLAATKEFGIKTTFQFWDWVGGRFSVCSCIGVLPLACHFGYEIVRSFLDGAHDMDNQFLNNPLQSNLPTLLGLIGYLNSQVMGYPDRAIIPYCQALNKFVAHVQQMDMESNGKSVDISHQSIKDLNQTGTVIFGEPGTNSQHSFFQLLHQGRTVPVEFIGYTENQNDICTIDNQRNHHTLMSNFFSQPDALALGKCEEQLLEEGQSSDIIQSKIFRGERGSISVLFRGKLDGFKCGQLLSLYEHRVAVEGWLLNVNSFDQMGVELGKVLAKDIAQVLLEGKSAHHLNQATQNILAFYNHQ